ncbi:hypothetical protein G3580_14160 [Nitrogeniibacter mangrovi]|uniref:Uncharacterized protein n=1 Tax=Nitrogeniibacter mangrovi TaxID=2016596 RepID=A0A6C1B4N3_9RHOO|nr:hypothetical protein [Nitrogeniibacter mangrovi]QID18666.1 hypothetical protein G3580_14160 [Nitrogeniibacter mangrovi]
MSAPPLERRFSKNQLQYILEQALIYQCACPAQVTKLISELVQLYDYQQQCLDTSDTDRAVHARIADTVQAIIPIVETCLADVLALEGWDPDTLDMPANLQKRLIDGLER